MTDTPKIEPALTSEQWSELTYVRADECDISVGYRRLSVSNDQYDTDASISVQDIPALIALANAALPDDDPRKITRETVELIRDAGWGAREAGSYGDEADEVARAALHRVADALESYLPPES